jgi:cytochrome c biogenesis protein CcmG/thiol:disulfide interchange protein DsbE
MRKWLYFLPVLIVVAGAAGNFSGCKSGGASTPKTLAAEPDVTFKDLQGKDVPLASLKGKVVVVNFWATWCEPCRVEIPWMIGFQQKYADKGFTLLGVAMDDEGKSVVEPYVQKTQFDVDGRQMTMNYPIVLGNDDLSSKFGGLLGLPTSIVISRDGKIAKRYIGLASQEDLEQEIKSLL